MLTSLVQTFNLWFLGLLVFWGFITPGLFLSLKLRENLPLEDDDILPTAILLSAGIGYVMFWAFFLNWGIGYGASYLLLAFTIWKTRPTWKRLNQRLSPEQGTLLLLLVFAAYLFYTGITVSTHPGDDGLIASRQVIHGELPGDNDLPILVATRLAKNQDPRILFGDWHSSDRPPLQSGLLLAQFPLLQPFVLARIYQSLSVILQVLWVAAVWTLCKACRFPTGVFPRLLLFCLFSGMFFMNSEFVWPKLLSANLFTIGFVYLCLKPDRPVYYWLGGLGMALAYLSHSGVCFSLLPLFFCFSLFKKIRPSLLFRTALGFVSLILPWTLYQKLYDPPGNRLLKWHFANVIDIDGRSFTQALYDSYHALTLSQIWQLRWSNLVSLLPPTPLFPIPSVRAEWNIWRYRDFTYLADDLGLLGLGFVVFAAWKVVGLIRRENRHLPFAAGAMLTYWGLGILLWCALMFGPRATWIYTGSYASHLFIYVWLGFFICLLPYRWVDLMLLCRGIYFFAAYVLYSDRIIQPHGYPQLFLAGFAGLALFGYGLTRVSNLVSKTPAILSNRFQWGTKSVRSYS